MSFDALGLSADLLAAVRAEGYTTPTPIQQQAIPVVIAGHDLMACAQTGTGKTAAFVLPILHRLTLPKDHPGYIGHSGGGPATPRVLVLVPTRELAAQVEESVRTYGRNTKVRSLAMFGGVGINPQIAALRNGVDFLVATPGRLMDHMQQRTVDLRRVAVLVLDEADRMLDMGFIRDMRKIVAALPKERQSLMFSATFSDEIRELAQDFLDAPQSVEVARRNTTVETVAQTIIPVDRERKKDLLLHLFEQRGLDQVLVFARTKHGADALARKLDKAGIRSAALHGNKSQGARTKALADFKAGRLSALVATDIAARGIDIDELPFVVNYELPNVPEDYVHRIGRTGRAGASGEAISLVCADEKIQLRDIERLIKRDLERLTVPGFEANLSVATASTPPSPRPGAPRGGRGNGQGQGGRPGGGQRSGRQQAGGVQEARGGRGDGHSGGRRDGPGEGRNANREGRNANREGSRIAPQPVPNRESRRHEGEAPHAEPRPAPARPAAPPPRRPVAQAAALLGGHKSGQRHK